MTPRKPQVRRRTRHALIIMPALHCTVPFCPSDAFECIGDYRESQYAAKEAGWGYVSPLVGGHGYQCPRHAGSKPWWPDPPPRLAIAAPDVPRPASDPPQSGPGDSTVPAQAAESTSGGDPGTAQGPDLSWLASAEHQSLPPVEPGQGSMQPAAEPGQPDDTAAMTVIDHGPAYQALRDIADRDADG